MLIRIFIIDNNYGSLIKQKNCAIIVAIKTTIIRKEGLVLEAYMKREENLEGKDH
jgi:hypothetical protein